eukprot:scaffold51034_cov25-Phaeocystis_antarctica.AAC.1
MTETEQSGLGARRNARGEHFPSDHRTFPRVESARRCSHALRSFHCPPTIAAAGVSRPVSEISGLRHRLQEGLELCGEARSGPHGVLAV